MARPRKTVALRVGRNLGRDWEAMVDISRPDAGRIAAITRPGRGGRDALRDFGRSLREQGPFDAQTT
ncbi:MAG: hypothetical protein ACXVQX_11785 [Actinomycetota bacterium]